MNQNTTSQPDAFSSFHDLPRARQIRAIQAWSESSRIANATHSRGGKLPPNPRGNRQQRRAFLSVARATASRSRAAGGAK
jgi:hypothetical protein